MMKNLMKYSLFLLNQEKTVKVKPNESYKPRERYQADIVLIPNCVRDEFKYIFTKMDHFTKYGWIINKIIRKLRQS